MNGWEWLKRTGVKRFGGRDIILVRRVCGEVQPFYLSTGTNSHMKGRWFPFDGLMIDGWFDKRRFVKDKYGNGDVLHRYGTEEMREISDELSLLDIPSGNEVEFSVASILKINQWIAKGKDSYRRKNEDKEPVDRVDRK